MKPIHKKIMDSDNKWLWVVSKRLLIVVGYFEGISNSSFTGLPLYCSTIPENFVSAFIDRYINGNFEDITSTSFDQVAQRSIDNFIIIQ